MLQGGSNTATCPENPCSSLERYQNTTTNGKNYGKGYLHKWRNNRQPQTAKLGKGMVEYHYEKQNNSEYNTYSRKGKRPSGLAFQEFPQTMGMETAKTLVQFREQSLRSIKDRSVRTGGQSSTEGILLPATGPTVTGYGCINAPMAKKKAYSNSPTLMILPTLRQVILEQLQLEIVIPS
ncbi:hypothetical protein BB558_002729 [Smittium angustum]|uniref:Uncharacterized protein n=1 Tax=Smittium angustum TaxID=133377 RepID=A0A2U1J806_SMIAN|nr:hypothetical protein BB558_002729 [Smittium angustum]